MTRTLLILLCALLAPAPSAMAQAWPNRPSGANTINDWGHDAVVGNGWSDAYDTTGFQVTIQPDGTAPLSPANVLQQRFPAGLIGGNGGGGGPFINFGATYPDIYEGFWFRTSCNYVNHQVLTKIAWLHTPGNSIFLGMKGSATGPYYFSLNYQWADNNPNNSHLGFVGSGYLDGPGVQFGRCQWVRVEWYFKPSTTNTSRDGRYHLWVNSSHVAGTDQLNTSSFTRPGITGTSYITIWGGTGGTNPTETYLYWDHTHLATGGTVAGGSPPPPSPTIDNPPGAPGLVSGFTATVGGVQ